MLEVVSQADFKDLTGMSYKDYVKTYLARMSVKDHTSRLQSQYPNLQKLDVRLGTTISSDTFNEIHTAFKAAARS